jgi:hypothetical protein
MLQHISILRNKLASYLHPTSSMIVAQCAPPHLRVNLSPRVRCSN